MKTVVEQWMEEHGYKMSPNFKKQDIYKWIQWRQGKVEDKEFEADGKRVY